MNGAIFGVVECEISHACPYAACALRVYFGPSLTNGA
jgi:hypothetical protein